MGQLTLDTSTLDPESPIYLGNPSGISAYADQQTDAANNFLLRLADATAGTVAPVISPTFPDSVGAPTISIPDVPEFATVVWTSPTAPSALVDTSIDIDDILPEPFDDDPPALVLGTAPAAFTGEAPEAPTVSLTYEEPELEVSLPSVPDLLTISVSPFDGLNLPTFSATEPTIDLTAPTLREYEPGDAYTSALLTAMQTSLQQRIEEGGSGLGQNAESAIWDRGREREYRSAADALLEIDRMEGLGYNLPPGIWVDARIKVQTETDYASRGHSREVMIESARLELDNVKHALTTATQLEGQLIDYTNAIEQRLFESTRYATEAGVAIYNARVQAFAGMVDLYRAKVQAYEAQIRAETSRVEAYQAEIAAEEAKARVNVALVEQYKAQADVALANIRIFEARIAGIKAKADIERAKVEIYGAQVQGYAAQINAYTAGVEGYRATLQAEETKQQVFRAQVDAYSARVGAATQVINARVAQLSARVDAKQAEIAAYSATVQGESARVQGIVSGNNALSEAYKAEVSGVSSYNDSLTKQWQTILDQNQRIAEIAINTAKMNAELYVTTRNSITESAKVGAQVSAQLGAAAINAINWSSSMSTSNAFGVSASWSNSRSNGYSESLNTNYNYSE